MFYAIDFDTRTVESKSEDGDLLAAYILDNDLSLAISIVDSEDELCLNFSLNEMQDLAENLYGKKIEFDNEDQAAKYCWESLEELQNRFPKFTPALGKKLLKGSVKQDSNTAKTSKPDAPRTKVVLELDATITIVDGKCKKGSILHTIVTAVEDEFCDTVGEILDYITENHIIPKTGELADRKFAEHNVKYFLKQDKISTGEEL